jgi:ABC-type thiamine transport system substrate-binding protein
LKEGLVATNESVAIVRSGDKAREDLAARYINHGLSPEAQMKFAEFFMTPINPKVNLPPAIAGEVLSIAEVQKLNHFDYIWMSTQADKWTEQWNKAISG